MGDRITTYLPCPNCGEQTEQYDASSSLIWSWNCEKCGWKDDRDYYEAPNNVLELCTEKQARGKGLIFNCPKCKEIMSHWEKEDYKMCIECADKEKK